MIKCSQTKFFSISEVKEILGVKNLITDKKLVKDACQRYNLAWVSFGIDFVDPEMRNKDETVEDLLCRQSTYSGIIIYEKLNKPRTPLIYFQLIRLNPVSFDTEDDREIIKKAFILHKFKAFL